MPELSHHREHVEETIDQLRELINKFQILENEYLEQEEKLFVISEFANDWEYWQAPEGHYKHVSPSCKKVTGYKPQDFYDDPDLLKKIIVSSDWDKWKAHSHSMAKNGKVKPLEIKIQTKKGKAKWIHHICQTVRGKNGENLGIRGSNRDITELKELQEKLKHMAGHDMLTRLPNRALFLEHLNQTIKEAKRNATMFAVVFLDLDDFKEINDTYGHEAGDTVLKKWSRVLSGVTRENDIVARLGGDEFVGLFNVSNDMDVNIIKMKMFNDLLSEVDCSTYNITIHYSLGVSIYPTDGKSIDTLLKKADQAMYRQKKLNKAKRKKEKK
jgi:diguanylate cyclase (GGDEF)-like protein/PAS domain S-box-containing protein